MALAPNTGFGLLNPGTTLPAPAPAPSGGGLSGALGPDANLGPGLAGLTDKIVGALKNPDNAFMNQGITLPSNFAQANGIPTNPQGQIDYTQLPPPTTTRPPAAQPNLTGLVNTFPGVSNALALEQEGIGQLDAALNQARQRAIINFGDPALAQMAGFGLDPQAGAFAQQNYLSGNATMARLDRAHQLAAQAVINQLASHGILNSGDLGYREGVENQNYGNQVYDAQQNVLQQLADLYNNYLNSRYSLENNANQAQLSALQSFLANPDAYSSLTQPQPKAAKTAASTTYAKAIKGPAIGAFK